ncbi:carbohydrate-binding module family 1 protein [Ramaria rubella]|nr:carbohydrate-binding module family 1 protein [Ramaria rubella]
MSHSGLILVTLLLHLMREVVSQSPAWGQCGGQNWSGASTCVSGYSCTFSNPYYSQCLPSTSGGSTSPTSASSASSIPTNPVNAPTALPTTATGHLPALG